MSEPIEFDRTVGAIVGAIFTDINSLFLVPPLILIPPFTFKVGKVLSENDNLSLLSLEEKKKLAEDIRRSIVPVMFLFDFESNVIRKIEPIIEAASLRVLERMQKRAA